MKRQFVLSVLSALIIIASVSGLFSRDSSAVTGSDWKSGGIISDSQFYNSDSMSVNDIQNFLNSRVSNCDTNGTQSAADVGYPRLTHAQYATQIKGWSGPPYVCLKDYMQVPNSSQIISNFQGSTPAGALSAAQIIKNAADTHSISPKVLLVTLHKESLNLIYDSWPMLNQYKNAMGYGCPDTAPCDPQYAGFYNQVNNAAKQFKLYRNNASSYRYKPFQNNLISFQANAPSCGASNVYIENYATAGLYNYTPYQPNQAALNNLYGTGDSCSAYGNRNFWRIYNDWFGSTEYEESLLSYNSQTSYIGWTDTIKNSGTTGVVGQGKPIEALRLYGDVEYSSYSFESGWQPTVKNGMVSGTEGQGKAIQAIKINPTTFLAARYDIYYRAHVSYIGWMGWAKNGEVSGATGNSNNKIEAIEIQLIPKVLSAPGSSANAYQNNGTVNHPSPLSLNVDSHVSNVGWQPTVSDGMITGTTGKGNAVEAIKLAVNNSTGLTGDIVYSTHISDIGWVGFTKNGEVSGTNGQGKSVQSIRVALTGSLSDSYAVWYRTYISHSGWLGWAKDGDPAGSVGAGRQIESIEYRLLPKNSTTLTQGGGFYNPSNQTIPDSYLINYSSHVSNIGWTSAVNQNVATGTTGQGKAIEALRIQPSNSIYGTITVDCTAFVRGSGWVGTVSAGQTCGTVGEGKTIQALRLKLNGSLANTYDVYYKAHVSMQGWQDWVKNDDIAGSTTANQAIEALIVKLVKK